MPADVLTAPEPSETRAFLPRLLLRIVVELRNLVLSVVLALLIVPLVGLLTALMIFSFVAAMIFAWRNFINKAGLRDLVFLVWCPLYMAGYAAAGLALTLFIKGFWEPFPHAWPVASYGPSPVAWLDVTVGGMGLLVAAQAAIFGGLWRLRQARQIELLPTSKAGAAAIGLVELRGKARAVEGRGNVILHSSLIRDPRGLLKTDCRRAPFYLEDETGRILVDPQDAEFRHPSAGAAHQLLGPRLCEIVLSGRVVRNEGDKILVMELHDGDPVCVVGSVEMNPEAPAGVHGTNALVVCMRREATPWTGLSQFLHFEESAVGWKRDFHHVFYLTDSPTEKLARSQVMRGFWWALFWAAVWTVASAWLIRTELPRARGDFARWTPRELVKFAPRSEQSWLLGADLERARDGLATMGVDDVLRFAPKPEAVRELLRRLETAGRPDRPDALAGLQRVNGVDRPVLLRLLKLLDEDDARFQAALVSGFWHQWSARRPTEFEDAVPVLVRQIRSRSIDVRTFAATALGRIQSRPQEAVPALRMALSDREAKVRAAAAFALPKFSPPPEEAGPDLVRLLEDPDAEVRRAAGTALWSVPLPAEGARSQLIPFRTSPDVNVRAGVARALGLQSPGDGVLELLRGFMNDTDGFVRESAVLSLGALGPKASDSGRVPIVSALTRALDDHAHRVRLWAARGLGEIGAPAGPAAPAVARLLEDGGNSQLRAQAAETLGRMGTAAAVALPAIDARLKQETVDSVRQALLRARKLIEGR